MLASSDTGLMVFWWVVVFCWGAIPTGLFPVAGAYTAGSLRLPPDFGAVHCLLAEGVVGGNRLGWI